ncbi:MAG: MFS transporter [Clostridia bacterium]|nr:MFS transporter [Clostridia bacterium]
MKVKELISTGMEDLRMYWKIPPKGRFMSFKEIFNLAIGSMGVRFIVSVVEIMILSTTNVLIGNTIGVEPMAMYVIYIISVIASIPLTGLRAKIIDNSRNKKGKYRPYIFYMAIPTAILAFGFVMMPYERMNMFWKCFTVLMYNIGFQFFYMFMYNANYNYTNVLSPNTIERSDIFSIKTITDSFAPTVLNFIIPLLAKAITGENEIYNMQVYRLVYPPVLVLGCLMSIFIYAGTEEKIIQAKTHVIQVKFTDSIRAVARNKYFWIISIASWISFLEMAYSRILGWMYNYQDVCTAGQYSIITMIFGNSSFIAMLFAPILIRKIGKRNLLIVSNVLNVGFILSMYPIVKDAPTNVMIWMFLLSLFINSVATSLSDTLNPSINGDIRDYQQYITGERIDGMFEVGGLIGSIINIGTNAILPYLYKRAGLNADVARSLGLDGSNVYDVLYNETYFRNICGVLIIASAVGASLNMIPYFFYDLTEIKQKAMVTVLKIRALFEDYGNGNLSDKDLVEAIDIIEEAKELENCEEETFGRKEVKEAVKSSVDKKFAKKQAKAHAKEVRERNEKIKISKYVLKEIEYFDSPEGKYELDRAEKICNAGLNGFYNLTTVTVAQAKSLPKNTPEEREFRDKIIDKAHQEKAAKKAVKKYYPNGIEEFDRSVFQKLFDAEDQADLDLKNAKTRQEIENARLLKKKVAHEIKKATNQFSIYNRAAKPYLDAKKLIVQRENYLHYEDIKSKYEESKRRAEEQRAAVEAAALKEKQEREDKARQNREERLAKKKLKKQ